MSFLFWHMGSLKVCWFPNLGSFLDIFLLLISNLILLRSENIICMISISLNRSGLFCYRAREGGCILLSWAACPTECRVRWSLTVRFGGSVPFLRLVCVWAGLRAKRWGLLTTTVDLPISLFSLSVVLLISSFKTTF